jgi:hypothetical protein
MQHEVRIWKTSHKVSVEKMRDGNWEAIGQYQDKEIRVTARNADEALRAWVTEARNKGV